MEGREEDGMICAWEVEKARKEETSTIKDWIWGAANGTPVPGCLSVEALRFVLIERGEDGKGYHNT